MKLIADLNDYLEKMSPEVRNRVGGQLIAKAAFEVSRMYQIIDLLMSVQYETEKLDRQETEKETQLRTLVENFFESIVAGG